MTEHLRPPASQLARFELSVEYILEAAGSNLNYNWGPMKISIFCKLVLQNCWFKQLTGKKECWVGRRRAMGFKSPKNCIIATCPLSESDCLVLYNMLISTLSRVLKYIWGTLAIHVLFQLKEAKFCPFLNLSDLGFDSKLGVVFQSTNQFSYCNICGICGPTLEDKFPRQITFPCSPLFFLKKWFYVLKSCWHLEIM